MKINLDVLIEAVNDCDYRTEVYRKSGKGMTKENVNGSISYIYEKYNAANNTICEMCRLIGVDMNQVYKLGRAVRKWEKKNSWKLIFPTEKNYDKIMGYILPA